MAKFKVFFSYDNPNYQSVIVEADNEDEAREKVETEDFDSDDVEYEDSFNNTQPDIIISNVVEVEDDE